MEMDKEFIKEWIKTFFYMLILIIVIVGGMVFMAEIFGPIFYFIVIIAGGSWALTSERRWKKNMEDLEKWREK